MYVCVCACVCEYEYDCVCKKFCFMLESLYYMEFNIHFDADLL